MPMPVSSICPGEGGGGGRRGRSNNNSSSGSWSGGDGDREREQPHHQLLAVTHHGDRASGAFAHATCIRVFVPLLVFFRFPPPL